MIFDPLYLVFMVPGLLLALIATFLTRSTFSRYSRVAATSGVTGAEAAKRLLSMSGIRDVNVQQTGGMLSDHYDPSSKTLRLSEGVYNSASLAAIGVACHEAGHALQHASGYAWLGLRTTLVPVTQFGSNASYFIILIGMMFNAANLILLGAILFSAVVAFSLITLPVEWDASNRAKRLMVTSGVVSPREQPDAAKVLNAAFLTYLAAAITALLQLLYYLIRAGVIGGRRDD